MPSPSSRTIDPRQHGLLSNGRYSVMLSCSGSGYSQWHDLAVTRWREDPTRDPWGSYLLLRDEDSGAVWSTSQQPQGTMIRACDPRDHRQRHKSAAQQKARAETNHPAKLRPKGRRRKRI